MLTLWNWREGQIVLRAKAFSQEVYKVKFSPYEAKRLGTSGTGHIRFWNMAATFTGLKLQVRRVVAVGVLQRVLIASRQAGTGCLRALEHYLTRRAVLFLCAKP